MAWVNATNLVAFTFSIHHNKEKGGMIYGAAGSALFFGGCTEGSITGAANYLHLTQPTLSRQIRDLENELGCTLLLRKSHQVTLTPEGMLLRQRAEEIVAMADKTQAEFSALENSIGGDIYLGGGETQAIRPSPKS